jgi:peptide/nickel transport system substrate-binding protein
MSHRPARLVAAIATVVGLLVLSTGLSSAQEPPPPKTTFTVGVVQDVDSLNPFIGITVAAYETFQMVYPPLTLYGAKDFSIQPGLAESWQESPDKTFWTYKIRPALKWRRGAADRQGCGVHLQPHHQRDVRED